MGMMPGMSRAMVAQQAKGEKDTLTGRVLVTENSISELEAALNYNPAQESDIYQHLGRIERCVTALINVNLTQLKGNLKEGTDRIAYLNEVIKQAESPVHRASIVHPATKQ